MTAPAVDDGSDLQDALSQIHKKLASSDSAIVLEGLVALKPLAEDLDQRRRLEQQTKLSQAHDTPWNVLVHTGVMLDIVRLYIPSTKVSQECVDLASPWMASWSRACSHSRGGLPCEALLPHIKELVQAMMVYLSSFADTTPSSKSSNPLEQVVKDAQSALHMLTTGNEDVLRIIEPLGVVDVLADFCSKHPKAATLSASIALGQLVARETDSQRIQAITADSHVAETIVSALDQLLNGETLGFYTLGGLTIAASCLAINDANKRLLVKAGIIPLLHRILSDHHQTKVHDPVKSRCYAAEAIWNLAFLKDLHPRIRAAGILPLLHSLKDSSNSKEQYYATGALFQLGEQNLPHPKQDPLTASENDVSKREMPMVMLSYNWGVQEVVTRIKDELQKAGFTVWIDLEKMQGSTLQAMAEAVEQSSVVITCVSRKYQESAACRTEAEYAYSLQKDVVPLMFEQQPWRATGWLGAQLGTKLWYDFSSQSQFQKSIQNLVKTLRKQLHVKGESGSKENEDETSFSSDSTVPMTNTSASKSQSRQGKSAEGSLEYPTSGSVQDSNLQWNAVAAMNQEAILLWLSKIGLESLSETFVAQNVTGHTLVELYLLRYSGEYVDLYYQFVKELIHPQSTGRTLALGGHIRELMVKGPPDIKKSTMASI